ncbi:MAG: PAS-domain containing protein [Pseudomonadota bacterium]
MDSLLNPTDTVERQRDKLVEICGALMRRVQQTPDDQTTAYVQFERAALLEAQVRTRTADLEKALDLLNESNAQLADANMALETARSNLDEALESMDDGFALFDRDETLQLFNSRFCNGLGDVKAKLAKGMSFHEFVEKVSGSRYLDLPENMGPQDWARRRLIRHEDQRVVFNIALVEDRWMQVGEHRTQEGGTVILQTDVTDIMREQRRQRETLVDTQARMLRATLDHLEQGICIFSERGRLVGWNHMLERMMSTALPRMGMAFTQFVDLFCPMMSFSEGSGLEWLKAWADHWDGRKPITFELTDKTGIIFSVFAQEMPDHGFVISFSDVTVQHRAAAALRDVNKTLEQRVALRTAELGVALEQAERANETKSRFVAAAGHDLLQPLSAAKLFAASLQDQDLGDEANQISDKVVGALASVEGIIEALLDISKLDVGQATFDIQDLRLSDLFSSLATELLPSAQAKGLDLRVIDSDAWVVTDAVFLRRILQNLITNAIRYTHQGRVVVGVRRDGASRVRIEVHDTGPGIDEADHEKIFKEFSRLSPSRSGSNGLGLGLAIVDRACRSLGHPLSLRSVPGRGSCFAVTLETAPPRQAAPHLAGAALSDPSALEGKILLLVENDPVLSGAIEHWLEGWGAHVLCSGAAVEALDMLGEIDIVPDAMVLDYQIDGLYSGLDLHREVIRRYGPVPALVISADRSPELRLGCEVMNLPLLTKPLDPEELKAALETLSRP